MFSFIGAQKSQFGVETHKTLVYPPPPPPNIKEWKVRGKLHRTIRIQEAQKNLGNFYTFSDKTSSDKSFVGQKFRHLDKISSVLSER